MDHKSTISRLLQYENLSASELARRTGISQPTVSRTMQQLTVIKIGKARNSVFALATHSYPVYEVNASGWPEKIATLHSQPNGRFLLTAEEQELHWSYDDIPYFLNAALPSGFLGRILGEKISSILDVG